MNQHLSILIRNSQALDEHTRAALYAELRLKHNRFATFRMGDEEVIAVFFITEYNVARLLEHYRIAYDVAVQEG